MSNDSNDTYLANDILIVDDESANLKLLSEILVREGYRVRPANSPRLAIDSALGKPPDLVLLDVRMPDMDGFEVCGILKQDERTSNVPILFISALQDTKDKVRAFEAGGVDFITKPFQEEEVLARVRTHLSLHNIQRHLEELVAKRTAELSKSEQLARSLLNATTDLTHLIDEDGIILDLNDSSAEKLGGTREELLGTNVFDKFSPELAEARHNIARKALATGESIRFVDRFRPGDVYDTGVYPIETPAGEKGKVVIFAHDIRELEQSQHALTEANKKMRLAAESAQFGIWDLDVKANRLEWDDWMFRLYGVSPDNFSGTYEAWQTGVHPDDWERSRHEMAQALCGEKEFDTEFRVVRPDGQVRHIRAHAIVSRDSQGKPIKMTGINYDITRERQAESALHQKVKQMRTILDTVPAYIFAKDINGRFLLANKAVADVFGVDPEQVVGKTDLDYGATEEQIRAYKSLDRGIIESQKSHLIPEEQRMRKDGTLGWFQTTKIPYQHPGYDKPAILGVAVEITERKQAEEDLQKNRDYLKHLIQSIPDAVFSVKLPERTINWANDTYNVLGYDPAEYIGKTTELFYSSDDEYQAISELLNSAVRDNKDAFIAESQVRNKYGETIPVEISTTIYRDKGVPVSVTALVRNISFRKKSQAALENSEARLKEAQRIALMGNWELDLLTDTLTWSEEVFRIFEMDPNDFVESYEAFLNAIHPEDRDTVNDAYKRSLKTRQPYGLDHRLLMPDGRIKYVREQCETYYSPEGKPLRSVGTVQDITASKQADEERMQLRLELAHLNRVLQMNELSSSLAHEINQPLGAILNNASAAQILSSRNKERDDEIDEILGDIIQDATRIGQVIQRIRQAIKKEEPTFKPLNLNDLIKDVVESSRRIFRKNHVSVVLDLQPNHAQILGDYIGLQQVLINLITNALEAMRGSSSKTLEIGTVMPSPDMLMVSVGDSGIGIDETTKGNLFTPFFTTKKDGLGMGLGICQAIIEEHGGRIWVENNSHGGATFSFSLKANPGEFK